MQQYEAALADYGRAIELDPRDVLAYSNRGLTYCALQQFEAALIDFGRAIGLDPNDAQAYSNRGNTYHALQQYEPALADYVRALELDPCDAQVHLGLGAIWGNQGMYQKALPYFEKAAQLGDPRGAQYAGIARRALGMEVAPSVDLVQQASRAFQRAGSLEAMQQVVARFPRLAHFDMIAAMEQAIAQSPPAQRPAFEQRLAWLRQIASKQKRES